MCLSTGGKWLGVPRVPVCRPCEYKQTACCRSCRGHSKAGLQVAEQQHVETVARQGVAHLTPRVTKWLMQKVVTNPNSKILRKLFGSVRYIYTSYVARRR